MKKLKVFVLFLLLISFMYVAVVMKTAGGLGHASQLIVDVTEVETGALNAVTAIVFDFRGYDTLGESVVLFTAICGVASVLRKNSKLKKEKN